MSRGAVVFATVLAVITSTTATCLASAIPAFGVSGTGEVAFLGRSFASFGVGSFLLLEPDGTPSWSFDYTLCVVRTSILHTEIRFGSLTARAFFPAGWGAPSLGFRVVAAPDEHAYGTPTDWLSGLEVGVGMPLAQQVWFHVGVSALWQYYYLYPSFAGASVRVSVTYLVPMVRSQQAEVLENDLQGATDGN